MAHVGRFSSFLWVVLQEAGFCFGYVNFIRCLDSPNTSKVTCVAFVALLLLAAWVYV